MQIFSSFWTWLGALILVAVVFDGISNIISAARPKRNVRIFRTDDTITFDIENAKQSDVDDALDAVTHCKKELDKID